MRTGALSAHLALPGSRWRLMLAAVLAVAAVVVGLLTMHSMAGTAAHHETDTAATVTQSVAAHDHADEAPAPGATALPAVHHDEAALSVVCDEACQMGCLMVGLICTLGLLAVLVAFSLPRVASAISGIMNVAQRVVSAVLTAVAPPRPPSLTALSISRT
jgi:hypothetical protein